MNVILLFSLVIIALAVGFYGIFCFVMMFLNVVPGRMRIVALLPLALFDSSLFNEKGNRYRKHALGVNVGFLVLIVSLAAWV